MLSENKKYNVIGVMSGTSLDGLDIAQCEFWQENNNWKFNIVDAHTFKYSSKWLPLLINAHKISSSNLIELNNKYGDFIGEKIILFLDNRNIDFIASHGHTVFHNPKKKYTYQIGNGANIAATTKIKTISDFRILDVSLGGQGAPLVPIGDKLLFSNYDYCINLGGFANISFCDNNKRIAFDICPVNIVSNNLVSTLNLEFDKDGEIGKSGVVNFELLNKLNSLEYYSKKYPKSLGREWVEKNIFTIFADNNIPVNDSIRTLYEHISIQISCNLNKGRVLITGGGAKNKFLISLIRQKNKQVNFIIPDNQLIDFKEALIFAFLGVLRINNQVNTLSSVTGAYADSSGGVIFDV